MFWTDAFTTFFPVPENNSSSLQYRQLQNLHSLILCLYDRGEIKIIQKMSIKKTLFVVLRLQIFLLESYMPGLGYHFPRVNGPDPVIWQGISARLCCSAGDHPNADRSVSCRTMLSHHPRALGSALRSRSPGGWARRASSCLQKLVGPPVQFLGVPGPMVMIAFLDCSNILK